MMSNLDSVRFKIKRNDCCETNATIWIIAVSTIILLSRCLLDKNCIMHTLSHSVGTKNGERVSDGCGGMKRC